MAWRSDDRWLWLGLGVLTFVAVRTVASGLQEVLRLTETHEEAKTFCMVSQDTEDAIDGKSLVTLSSHSNVDIRNTALKILCERFLNNQDAQNALEADLSSEDEKTREQAILAMRFLDRVAGTSHGLHFIEADGSTPHRIRPRARNESPEEQALRRRRREAIVLNEGDRPLSQEDIIQRRRTD